VTPAEQVADVDLPELRGRLAEVAGQTWPTQVSLSPGECRAVLDGLAERDRAVGKVQSLIEIRDELQRLRGEEAAVRDQLDADLTAARVERDRLSAELLAERRDNQAARLTDRVLRADVTNLTRRLEDVTAEREHARDAAAEWTRQARLARAERDRVTRERDRLSAALDGADQDLLTARERMRRVEALLVNPAGTPHGPMREVTVRTIRRALDCGAT
jgi:chromosome segregation ATPase